LLQQQQQQQQQQHQQQQQQQLQQTVSQQIKQQSSISTSGSQSLEPFQGLSYLEQQPYIQTVPLQQNQSHSQPQTQTQTSFEKVHEVFYSTKPIKMTSVNFL
jgi:hypothetical protein